MEFPRSIHYMSCFYMAMLSGCGTIFDAPADHTDFIAGVSDQVREDLSSLAQQQSHGFQGKIPAIVTSATVKAEQQAMKAGQGIGENIRNALSKEKIQRQSPVEQGREPEVYFERIASDMPHFTILGARMADIWLNERKIEVPEGSSSHAFLINPGKYRLKVDYQDSPAFLADIWIAQYERIIVRLDARVMMQKAVQSDTISIPNSSK